MKVIEKQNGGHNLPRLGGTSPTQSNASGMDEERSTNIMENDFQPPNNVNQSNNHPLPLTPRSSASVSTPTSVFFPPLPPRSTKTRSHMLPDHSTKTDFNMNSEHERNREHSANNSISPQTPVRLIGTALNSPSIPSKVVNSSFFPESKHLILQKQSHQTPATTRLSSHTPTCASSTGGPSETSETKSDRWPQQQLTDDNYHLYHEPIDMDEHQDSQNLSPSANGIPHCSIMAKDSDALNLAPIPPRPRPNSSMAIRATSHDKSDISPTMAEDELRLDGILQRRVSSSFAHRVGLHRDDVSADIYFRYVTVKPSERSNYKSRSYHGSKNTTNHSTQDCHPFVREAPTDSSTTSVVELPLTPTLIKSPDTPMLFRDHCVKELIETELNYVHALEMIINKFARPLEVLLRRDDNLAIFGHIRDFYCIHKKFQANLVKATCGSNNHLPKAHAFMRNSSLTSSPSTPTLTSPHLFPRSSPLASPTETDLLVSPKTGRDNNDSSMKISSCFLKVKNKFLKYGEYCATLAKVQSLLDDLISKNEAIAAQLDRCQQEANEGRFKLRDLLSLPMQRILKYHLLLAQIIKNTDSGHDDYQGLKRAYESMVDLCEYINEVARDTEAIQIISCVESSIVGLNLPPNTKLTDYGRLVIDDLIRIKTPQDNKQKVIHDTRLKIPLKSKPKMYVFVFDKVMLITVRTRINGATRYEYKEALVLSEYELDMSTDTQSSETLGKWSFQFTLVKTSDRSSYTFYLKTQEMKAKWISSIKKAMENTRPLPCRKRDNNHEFLMHTFEKASSCDHCGKLLHGLFYQGYRCRVCFISVHKKCLDNVKLCGPALPPKLINNAFNRRSQCNEPPSPSIRSNCSVENGFLHLPSSQCEDALLSNEYSNIVRGSEQSNHLLSSFRERNSRTSSNRPVASMINVSSQNSSPNHLLRQRRLLSSASTPAISKRTCLRARAISDFDGKQEADELDIRLGDLILIDRDIIKPTTPQDELDDAFSQLGLSSTDDKTWWSGKNTRTNEEGRFPADVVRVINDLGDNDYMKRDDDNNVDFIMYDLPWFCGRMERERAQVLLEGKPHETFLVRVSLKHNGSYVISLKFNSQVKHMRIYVSQDGARFYLSQNRHFRSIIDLVNWYGENSLVESFHMLDARLSFPYKST